jgi:hypothetical protein
MVNKIFGAQIGCSTDDPAIGRREKVSLAIENSWCSVPYVTSSAHSFEQTLPGKRRTTNRRIVMKTILSALVALSLLGAIAAPASADDDCDDAATSSPL